MYDVVIFKRGTNSEIAANFRQGWETLTLYYDSGYLTDILTTMIISMYNRVDREGISIAYDLQCICQLPP